jgi:hypothetical protein
MVENKEIRDSIPEHFMSIEEAAEFWDNHDLANYWDLTEEVEIKVNLQRRRYLVSIDPELAEKLAVEAHRRGLSTETLVNLWLNEKLQQTTA